MTSVKKREESAPHLPLIRQYTLRAIKNKEREERKGWECDVRQDKGNERVTNVTVRR